MASTIEYRRRVEHCLRMGERSDSPETKTVLWVMAREDIERVSVKAVRAERCDEQSSCWERG